MATPGFTLSPRLPALAAIVFFLPVVVSFAVAPTAWWPNYPGLLFHLSLFFLVSQMDAPEWGKAAGYAWLALDVTTGVMSLNGVPITIALYVRFGGHIFAGLWIIAASLHGSAPMKAMGYLTGACMSLFTFVSPFVSPSALAPASIFVVIWLGIIAWQDGARRSTADAETPRPCPPGGMEQARRSSLQG